jgi:DNA-binding beta-propeller fold protein YncE
VKSKIKTWLPVLFAAAALLTPNTKGLAGEVYLGAATLYVIDEKEGRIEASIPVGRWIHDIAVSDDGRIAYLGTSRGVEVVDLDEREIRGIIGDLPAPTIVLDDENHRLYVLTNERVEKENGTMEALPSMVQVYDTLDRGLLQTIELERIVFDITVIPDQDRLYCLDILDSEIKVVKLSSGVALEIIRLGNYGFEFKDEVQGFLWRMIHRPGENRIYVPQGGKDAGLLVVETATNSVRRIPVGHEAKWRGGVIAPDGRRIYLNGVRYLSVIDLEREAEVTWRPLDVPYQGIALGPEGKRLYLANPVYDEGGSLAVLDAGTLDPVTRVVVQDASPFTVAVSPIVR